MEIRQATANDSGVLSALALAAKAHWGYSHATMTRWERQLRVSALEIAAKSLRVAEIDGEAVGFYALAHKGKAWRLDDLWVAPAFRRQGIGRALLMHALDIAFHGGGLRVTVDADPNAEAFYLACGAIRCGEIAAPLVDEPDRIRPQLVFCKSAGDAAGLEKTRQSSVLSTRAV